MLSSFCRVQQSQGTSGLDRTEDMEKQPGAGVGSAGLTCRGLYSPPCWAPAPASQHQQVREECQGRPGSKGQSHYATEAPTAASLITTEAVLPQSSAKSSFNFLRDCYIMLYLCAFVCVYVRAGRGNLKARPVRCHHTLISFYT